MWGIRPSRRTTGGFTTAELIVALFVGAMVVAVASNALILTLRSSRSSEAGIESSNSAFQTGTRFGDDVASVGPVPGVTQPVADATTGCGNTAAVLRLLGPSTSGGVLVRSYHRVAAGDSTTLVRRECSESTLSAALAATYQSTAVVTDLDPASGSVTVECDGGPVSATCRIVTMTVLTTSGREFTTRGTIGTALNPTATTTPTQVQAPPSGTCTLAATATTWGATGGKAGSSNDTHNGDPTMYTYDDTNRRYSFVKVDLTGPCIGASDSWPTLPGGRTLTGATLQLRYTGRSNTSCYFIGPIIGYTYPGQRIEPLNDASTWNEATLNGSNMPSGLRSGYVTNFNVPPVPGNTTTGTTADAGPISVSSVAMLDAVRGWYQAGGWTNNGWRIARSGAGDTCSVSVMYASRFATDSTHRPQLVVTWVP